MKKVALTGANGFTGRYVKSALESAGFEAVDVKSDITDGVSLAYEIEAIKPSAVLHLAAISFPAHDDYRQIYDINLHGTVNLLRAIKKTKSVKKIVLASSSNVYGNVEGSINENMPPKPVNHYGISKLAMEYAAAAEGVECIIARPFNYTGIGQAEHFLVPKIVSHFKHRLKTIELGNIDVYRDFSDVRWVGNIYTSIIESDITSGIFNICSEKAVSLKYIIEYLEKLAGYKIEIKVNPAFVRENEIEIVSGDMALLRQYIPNSPKPIEIDNTLEWIYKEGSAIIHTNA